MNAPTISTVVGGAFAASRWTAVDSYVTAIVAIVTVVSTLQHLSEAGYLDYANELVWLDRVAAGLLALCLVAKRTVRYPCLLCAGLLLCALCDSGLWHTHTVTYQAVHTLWHVLICVCVICSL